MDKIGVIFAMIVIGLFTPVVGFLVYNNIVSGNWTPVATAFYPLAIGSVPIVTMLYLYTLIRRRRKEKKERGALLGGGLEE